MAKVGTPSPSVAAVVVMAVAILGGLALILGRGTRLAAALLAIEMVVAILAVRRKMGFVGGYEFELTLLAASLSLVLLGAGPMTVKKVFARGAAPAPEAPGSRGFPRAAGAEPGVCTVRWRGAPAAPTVGPWSR